MTLCTDAYGTYVDCTDPTAMFQVPAAPQQGVGASLLQQHEAAPFWTTPTFSVLLLIAVACLVLCIKLAKHKGYGTAAGVIVGLLIPVIGVIFFALVPAKTTPETPAAE